MSALDHECPRCGRANGAPCMGRDKPHAERMRAASATLAPLLAQLDLDGGAHEIAPEHERMRLFQPPANQLEGQSWLELDSEE